MLLSLDFHTYGKIAIFNIGPINYCSCVFVIPVVISMAWYALSVISVVCIGAALASDGFFVKKTNRNDRGYISNCGKYYYDHSVL